MQRKAVAKSQPGRTKIAKSTEAIKVDKAWAAGPSHIKQRVEVRVDSLHLRLTTLALSCGRVKLPCRDELAGRWQASASAVSFSGVLGGSLKSTVSPVSRTTLLMRDREDAHPIVEHIVDDREGEPGKHEPSERARTPDHGPDHRALGDHGQPTRDLLEEFLAEPFFFALVPLRGRLELGGRVPMDLRSQVRAPRRRSAIRCRTSTQSSNTSGSSAASR